MDLIRCLQAFVRVAEAGSLSAVARDLHESHSSVTRQIGQLEAHFGVRLFQRNTRRLSLTEDGRELLGRAQQMLELAEAMESGFGSKRASPQGLVRLCVSVAAGMFLVPRLSRLLAQHPGLSIELMLRDTVGDLIEERLDLAVHAGPVADGSLIARSLSVMRRVIVATPDYLARRGAPRSPAELAGHSCILHSSRDAGGWRLIGPEGEAVVPLPLRLAIDNSNAVYQAALAGEGMALLSDIRVTDDLRTGRLQRVLADHQAPDETVHLVYPSRRHLPPRTRVVIDFLVEQFAQRAQETRQAMVRAPIDA